jgi:plastocyanin
MKTPTYLTSILTATLLGACGGSQSSGGGTGTCTPGSTASFSIMSTGVTPKAVCVLPGGTVTFMNADTAQHDIESGTTCTQLNLGVIAAGGSATATFPTVEVCPFHDQLNPTNTAFQGNVYVTTAPAPGPGY